MTTSPFFEKKFRAKINPESAGFAMLF